MTSGQEMERVSSYNPGIRMGLVTDEQKNKEEYNLLGGA